MSYFLTELRDGIIFMHSELHDYVKKLINDEEFNNLNF